MNQNTFCKNCHRIPSQCCCSSAKELTDEEIAEEAKKWGMMGLFSERQFARAIIKKASEK
jgi:hypothetical protein